MRVQWCSSCHKPDFGGKSETIFVRKTAPAGLPKSDCQIRKPQKYGATMAARFGFGARAASRIS
jgi:hypothetical protein